jgi:hypothetical protein
MNLVNVIMLLLPTLDHYNKFAQTFVEMMANKAEINVVGPSLSCDRGSSSQDNRSLSFVPIAFHPLALLESSGYNRTHY